LLAAAFGSRKRLQEMCVIKSIIQSLLMRRIHFSGIDPCVADEVVGFAWLYSDSIRGYDRASDPDSGEDSLTFVLVDGANYREFERYMRERIGRQQSAYVLRECEISEEDPTIPRNKIPFPMMGHAL